MRTETAVLIRPFAETDSIAKLTELLHRAYAELGEQRLRFTAVDQSESKTRERVAKGRCFVATIDGVIAGTITYYPAGANPVCEWYRRPGIATFGQFGVDPDQRGRRIGSLLLEHVEGVAREDGAHELALDTAEAATALVKMYLKMGYRAVAYDDFIVPAYRSVVMSKTLR